MPVISATASSHARAPESAGVDLRYGDIGQLEGIGSSETREDNGFRQDMHSGAFSCGSEGATAVRVTVSHIEAPPISAHTVSLTDGSRIA